MAWPLELFLFSVVIMFLWGLILQKASKNTPARVIVKGNIIIYLIYTFFLFKPLISTEPGEGGVSFVASLYILIIAPIHLLAVYFAVLIFNTSGKIQWLRQILTFAILPVVSIAFGYNWAVMQQNKQDYEMQQRFAGINERDKQEKQLNSRSDTDFELFIQHFSSDSVYQRKHIQLPLPEFYLTSDLKTDTVNHLYEHSLPFLLTTANKNAFIYSTWETSDKASEKRSLVVHENDWLVQYHFEHDQEWQLVEIIKQKLH